MTTTQPRTGTVQLSDVLANPDRRLDAEYWLDQQATKQEAKPVQRYELDVTFQTARPLSQDMGSHLWAFASLFHAVGPSTYQLHTVVERLDAATLLDALTGLVDAIATTVAEEQRDWPIRVTAVEGKEVEQIVAKR